MWMKMRRLKFPIDKAISNKCPTDRVIDRALDIAMLRECR